MKVSLRALLGGAAVPASLLLLFALPIRIPYSVKAPGKILPAKEWIVVKGADGQVMTMLVDHVRGVTANYAVSSFERSDALQFTLRDALATGAAVAALDTVGYAYSSDTEQQLARLRGELAAAQAALALNSSGEKEAIVEEARQQVAQATTRAEEFQKTLRRQKTLYENRLISQDDFDAVQAQANLHAIAIAIAQARLQAVQSGAKKEQIELAHAHTRALQEEIEVVQQRAASLALVSPMGGVVRRAFFGDTLLVIADTSSYIVLMPVRVREGLYLAPRQPVFLRSRDVFNLPQAELLHVETAASVLQGKPVLPVTAALHAETSEVVPGLVVQCTIRCDGVSPAEYLKRKFQTLVGHAF
jgi:hypothetical protein